MAGLPRTPNIFWASGDEAFLFRTEPVTKGNRDLIRIWIIPTERTKFRYGIKDKDLLFGIYSYGHMIKEYPADLLRNLSPNPENPFYFFECTFAGVSTLDNEIGKLKNDIVRLKSIIRRQEEDIERLNEQLKEKSEEVEELLHG